MFGKPTNKEILKNQRMLLDRAVTTRKNLELDLFIMNNEIIQLEKHIIILSEKISLED